MDEMIELKKQKEELEKEIDSLTKDKKNKLKKIKEKMLHLKSKNNGISNSNELIRVSKDFNKEVENIIESRIKNGLDENPTSKPKVTDLIVKHKTLWPKLKEDVLNFNFFLKNNKGQTTIFIALLILGLFFAVVLLLVGGIGAVRINNALSQNVSLGNVNLATINAQTFGVFTTTYLNSADWWGIAAIFGMIIGLFLSSYFTRNKFPKWGLILDIFIIIAMFIFALYMSKTYNVLLDALASAGETFLEDYAPKTSLFMLNLPIFIVIIGVIMMVLFHSSIPKKSEETNTIEGGLQAI